MEILVYAIVAGFGLYAPEKKFVPEPYPFQPFDVQALNQVYNARVDSSNRSSGRRKSYAVEALS